MSRRDDGDLIALAARELGQLGFDVAGGILGGAVIREANAYPVYAGAYLEALGEVRRFLTLVPNLQLAGRNGTHSYNNLDHAMMSGLLAARGILGCRDAAAEASLPPEALPMGAAGAGAASCRKGKGMAGTTRLELATSDVTGRRSNQLNYVPASSRRLHSS